MRDILSGKTETSTLMPLQMPVNMQTVETQKEDVPQDMQPYNDSEVHIYDFASGLNWKGVIKDAKSTRYKKNKI